MTHAAGSLYRPQFLPSPRGASFQTERMTAGESANPRHKPIIRTGVKRRLAQLYPCKRGPEKSGEISIETVEGSLPIGGVGKGRSGASNAAM